MSRKPRTGLVDRFQSPIAGRIALAGLASVLMFLSGFAVWAARTTNEAARNARRFNELSDSYGRARFAVAEERSLEREYRLEPNAGTRRLFEQTSETFLESLAAIRVIGDRSDRDLVRRMSLEHKRYLMAIDQLFTAVDADQTALVQRIDQQEIDPVFSDIEERIYTASFQHQAEALERFRSLEKTEGQVLVGTVIAFAAGLALLAIFSVILVGHRRLLRKGEERFRSVVQNSSDVIVILSGDGTVVYQSRPLSTAAGSRQLVGMEFIELVDPQDRPEGIHLLSALKEPSDEGRHPLSVEIRVGDSSDSMTYCEVTGNNLLDDPSVSGIVLTLRDVSERKHAERSRELLEAQLRQSQKMEAIGQLAGGVAHDFNNLLSVILNYTRFSMEGLEEDDERRRDMEEVIRAGEQASRLTQQLLAFSRKDVAQPTDLNLNDVVADLERMLRRTLGEQVELETALDQDLTSIQADSGQIQQVIMNLCVNARDAMPEGGRLVLATSNETVDESAALEEPELSPGDYVCLTVTDSGIGMTDEVRTRIFDPFFTTKERGSGTGLGLSTVYGIAAQAGGHVSVRSQVGEGTEFRVYLPVVTASARDPARVDEPSSHRQASPLGGTGETVLVAEDEPGVREVVRRLLNRNGYEVLEAASGKEALSIMAATGRKIDVLLTDVVMPGLSGRDLATLVKKASDGVKVIFMSGYTNDIIAKQGVLHTDEILVQKPFTEEELLTKLREVVGTPTASSVF
jgi:PAS domain S-box-containing protein